MRNLRTLLISLILLLPVIAAAESTLFPTQPPPMGFSGDTPEFLPAEQAFRATVTAHADHVLYQFEAEPGYYLYRHRFSFTSPQSGVTLGAPVFATAGVPKQDPNFGDVEAYYGVTEIRVPVEAAPSTPFEVRAQYQGCADQGLCYLPQTRSDTLSLTRPATASLTPTPAAQQSNPWPPAPETAGGLASFLDSAPLWKVIGVFFALGLALALTPCVLPMVPILTSIVVGDARETSARRGFMLSSTYVLGMALTYTLAGVAAGASGAKLQFWLQTPAVVSATAALFVLLALSMFGFYELQLPEALRDRLDRWQRRHSGGQLAGAGIMGALSALVVSPCVSAPLMGALLYIGNTGDPWLGGTALMSLSLGMGAPLIVLGTTEANLLPRAGAWMDNVKALFGVMLLGVALWLVRYLLPDAVVLVMAGALGMLAGAALGAFDPISGPRARFFKALGHATMVLGAGLILGGSLQWSGVSLAGTPTAAALPFVKVDDERGLDAALAEAARNRRPVMVDVWADWCIACKEMEVEVLARDDVRQALAPFTLIKLDLTDSPDGTRLLERFHIPGPPAYLFFDRQGGELRAFHLVGSSTAPTFLRHVQRLPTQDGDELRPTSPNM